MESKKLQIGDELTIQGTWPSSSVSIHKVDKISPTGRITLDNGIVLNPDLYVRGASRPIRARLVTPEHRSQALRGKLINELSRRLNRLHEYDTNTLQRIKLALDAADLSSVPVR